MYLCPVCGKEIENTICSACGFDKSCDFENYPTLSEVSSQALGISNLKETYENKQKKYISCKNCGGRTFYIDIESGGILCSECLNPIDGRYESKSHPHNSEEATTKQYTVEQAVQEAGKLLELYPKQSYEAKSETIIKLKTLFEQFPFNSKIAKKYALCLACFISTQKSEGKEKIISELEKLYKQFTYNSEIAEYYALGLSLLSTTQDYSDKQDTVKHLKALYLRFRNEAFALFYAQGLRNLSRDQNITERQTTLLEIKGIYDIFKDSEEIAVIYAMNLSNICKLQRKTNLTYSVGTGLFPKKESIDAKTILKNLSSKFPQNRSIRQCTEEINEMSRY